MDYGWDGVSQRRRTNGDGDDEMKSNMKMEKKICIQLLNWKKNDRMVG